MIKLNSKKIDKFLLKPVFGFPIFLLVVYIMFVFTINFGGYIQNIIDDSTQLIFISNFKNLLLKYSAHNFLIAVLTEGLGRGINIVLSFIPVIACMFLFLSILEKSGYIQRAMHILDRIMGYFNLPGKSFIPIIIGFGCNVPAIMSARSLNKQAEKILTIMMTPFMSCGARLTIYAVFVSVFFPTNGQNVIFSLYILGIAVAIFTCYILKAYFIDEVTDSSLEELKPYKVPNIYLLFKQVFFRVKKFVVSTAKLIIPFCMGLSIITYFVPLEILGKNLVFIFKPMGVAESNWPAAISLLTGTVAKEIIVATLGTLYSVSNSVGLQNMLVSNFASQSAVYSYLIFISLGFPCISVIAAIAKELSLKWAIFSIFWTTGLAYIISVIFYQISNFSINPTYSVLSLLLSVLAFFSFIFVIKVIAKNDLNKKYKKIPTSLAII